MTDEWVQMHALADGELADEERAVAETHLAECPRCQAEHQAVTALKATLQTKLPLLDCADPWRKCSRRLDEIERAQKVQMFVTRYAWGFCGVFLALIVGAAMLNRTLGRNVIRPGEVAQMAASLVPMSAPSSQNPDNMRQWMSQVVQQAPMNIHPETAQILSAATGVIDGRRVVRINLRDRMGTFAVLGVSNSPGLEGVERLSPANEYYKGCIDCMNCVAWTDHGFALMVVGDRPIEQLQAIAESISVR